MKEIITKSQGSEIKVFPLVNKIPERFRKPLYALGTFVGMSSLAAVCSADQTEKTSDLQPKLDYSLTLPFAAEEIWWLTSGPHADGLSDGHRYALDFAPSAPIACPGNEPYREKFVRSIADGIIVVSGNEKDSTDKNHSIVEIDHGNSFTSGYMHLDEIQVQVGDKVKQGDPLGYASCESPAGGGTGGVHSHVFSRFNNEPIEIDRLVLSGWTIQATEGNYQGVMEKQNEEVRTADRGRCGPDEETIKACGGIRNDISWGNTQLEIVPTIALVPTLALVETIEKPVIPTVALPIETRQQEIDRYALVLDGSGDGVEIGDADSLNFSEGLTIEAEIEMANVGETDSGNAVLARGLSAEPFVLWASHYKCNGEMATWFHRNAWPCAGAVVDPGKKVNVAMAYDGVQITFYVDGKLVNRQAYEGGINDTREPIFIGRSPFGEGEDFSGKIFWVALWRRVRTEEEVASDVGGIENIAKAEDEGLVGFWQFKGNFGDSTSNHNDGKEMGDAHIEKVN